MYCTGYLFIRKIHQNIEPFDFFSQNFYFTEWTLVISSSSIQAERQIKNVLIYFKFNGASFQKCGQLTDVKTNKIATEFSQMKRNIVNGFMETSEKAVEKYLTNWLGQLRIKSLWPKGYLFHRYGNVDCAKIPKRNNILSATWKGVKMILVP